MNDVDMNEQMKRLRQAADKTGGTHQVSGMTLCALCNLAEIGLLYSYVREGKEAAARKIEERVKEIDASFSFQDRGGMDHLVALTAAILFEKEKGLAGSFLFYDTGEQN